MYVPRSHLGGGREFWFVSVCNSCLAQTLTQTTITSYSLIKMELPSWNNSGNFGGNCHTKYQPTEWILHRVWLWYSTNSAIYIGRVLSQFQARWRLDDTLHNVADFLKRNKRIWSLIPEDLSLVKMILVMPATNVSPERAFSALIRVKSYLRITMSNNRLNHLITCTVHKELVKELSLKQVTNDSVDRVERRSSIFGHFFT